VSYLQQLSKQSIAQLKKLAQEYKLLKKDLPAQSAPKKGQTEFLELLFI